MSVSTLHSVCSGPSLAHPIAPDNATRAALAAWQADYGDLFCVPDDRGGAPHWVVNDPALVQQVFVRRATYYAKGKGLDRVRILLGNGIMVSEGDFWTRQRRMLQPGFRPRRLADFNAMIVAENQALAARWADAAARGTPVDAESAISELTLVIVLKSIFGRDYARLVAGGDNPFALLTTEPTRDLRFAARFHALGRTVEAIVEQRLAERQTEFDFLGHMLAARARDGQAMTRRALVDEIMTLIVAGHETTASALAFAWYLLATHPAALTTAQAEADEIDEAGLAITAGHGDSRLAHIERVIKETMRLYPPGWLLSRRALVADELACYAIAPGTQLFISPWLLHRHPGYWCSPEHFDPDRFIAGREPRHRGAYIAFGAGPRHCIGEHLAMNEMRVHLALLLARFTPVWLGEPELAIKSAINLRPAGGIPLQLIAR